MNTHTTTQDRPRKKRFRLTLGATMILVLIFGGGIGWIAHRARIQREAVKIIIGAGGTAVYDWQQQTVVPPAKRSPPGPKWLHEALGPDVFDTVTAVAFQGGKAKPSDLAMAAMSQLGHLDQIAFIGCDLDAITPEGFAHLGSLSKLTRLSEVQMKDATPLLGGIARQPHLKVLYMGEARATDADMVHVGRMRDLTQIMLDGRNVTQKGFEAIADLRNVGMIRMRWGQTTDLAWVGGMKDLGQILLGDSEPIYAHPVANASVLWHLPKLKVLILYNHRITDADLVDLESATQLISFLVPDSELTDAGIEKLAKLTGLKTVSVGGRGITDAGLAILGEMPLLMSIDLRGTSVQNLRAMGTKLRMLGAISLSDCPISDDQLAALADANALESVRLDSIPITDAGLAHLSGLKALTSVHLDHVPITDAGLAHLAGLTKVRILDLKHTKITDAGLAHLAKMPRLREINLEGTAITDAGLLQLPKIAPSLAKITISGTTISEAAIEDARKMRNYIMITRK